ncbi:hypothetical protein OTU49_014148, partial [Cherax quadricarinatus]
KLCHTGTATHSGGTQLILLKIQQHYTSSIHKEDQKPPFKLEGDTMTERDVPASTEHHTPSPKIQLPVIEELNLYVNSKIAKIIATGVVICFITYHGFLRAVDGGDSCQRLLSDGRFQGALVWQPYGCMLHMYSNTDSRRCMRYVAFLKQDNHILFVGDSRIRQLYLALVKQ